MLNMDWAFVPILVIKAQSKHVRHQAEDGYTQGQVNNLVDMESSSNYEWLAKEILEVLLPKWTGEMHTQHILTVLGVIPFLHAFFQLCPTRCLWW